MSHVSTVACEIKDVEVMRAAAEKFGCELLYGKKQFQYYAGNKQKCDHAIRIPGSTYEVGLVAKKPGEEVYDLQCDFFDGKLTALLGEQLVNLRNEYTAVVTERMLQAARYRTHRVEEAGQIQVVAVG
jgi:hypothetical protein